MPQRRSWLRRFARLVGLALAAVGLAFLVDRMGGAGGPTVGVVELTGEIRDAAPLVESLETLRKDASVVAERAKIETM